MTNFRTSGVFFLIAATALASLLSTAGAQRLCSGGPSDGQPCASAEACPQGACVVIQGICNGGNDDGLDCDCPGSTCQTAPSCSSEPEAGTCGGGPFAGECCDIEFNCIDGAPCQGTQKVCLSGELKGFSCLTNAHCDGELCVSSGRVCSGDGFSCIDDEDCIIGTCTGAALPPTATPSPTRLAATATPRPATPTPVAGCTGDCDGDGEVTVDNIIVMVNIALEAQPVSACTAGDANGDSQITVDEIVIAVNNALNGCP
jgi:hypothetical protein